MVGMKNEKFGDESDEDIVDIYTNIEDEKDKFSEGLIGIRCTVAKLTLLQEIQPMDICLYL